MATNSTPRRTSRLIAPLTRDSWDPDAREDANNPALVAELRKGRSSAQAHGGGISQEELRRELALTDDEVAAANAELDRLEALAEEEARRPKRRASGPRPTVPNGKILLRVPLSVHRELLARAEADQTSLNQLLLAYVSRGLGQDAGPSARCAQRRDSSPVPGPDEQPAPEPR
jgi:hypothetical protein